MLDNTNTFLYKLLEADETKALEVDQIIEGKVISNHVNQDHNCNMAK